MSSIESWKISSITLHDGSDGGTKMENKETDEEFSYTFARSLIDGVPHPPFITEDSVKHLKQNLKFREGDTFVCTYSKCGTTLMEQIVLLLQNEGDVSKLNPLHKNTYDKKTGVGKIWPEMAVKPNLGGNLKKYDSNNEACTGENKANMSVQEFDALKAPRILKTHAPPRLFLDLDSSMMKMTEGVKIIYVTRNPFDACVSCYYHPKPGVSPQSTGCSFEAFAKLWLSDRIEFGGWCNHVKGWRNVYLNNLESSHKSSKSQQIIWISYEDLIMKPRETIEKIAFFLDIDASPGLINLVLQGCKFDNVKEAAEKAIRGGIQGNISHLRKGKIGDWRNHFTDATKNEFEEGLKRNIPEGIDFEYYIGNGQTWKLDSTVC